MTVVGLVLLIACANIANLLLARAAAREKEISVRLAMGAGRARIAMQLLTESVLLALIGGALGIAFAAWGTRILLRLVSNGPTALPLEAPVDARVLAFTAVLAVLTGILFGLAPAFRAGRMQLASSLKENSRGVIGRRSHVNVGSVLVMTQIAMSVLLLIGAGLFVRTLYNLKDVKLGYPKDKLILMDLEVGTAGYKDLAALNLYTRILDKIRAIPGVKSATYSQNGLFGGGDSSTQLDIEGYKPAKGAAAAAFDQIGPNYFSTLGIPLLRGREIGSQDTPAGIPVCVINQAMAREFFAGRDPIGKQIRDLFPGSKSHFEIVGVASDARDHNLKRSVPARFYAGVAHPLPEMPDFVTYEVRTFADPPSVTSALRAKVRETDRALSINSIHTIDELVDARVAQERLIAQLSTFFGALALLLASVGLYGVLSYAVARRTNEIGIRMALGAEQGNILGMILRETLVLVGIGAVVGIGSAMGLARLVASRFYGVSTADPATILMAGLVLTVVAMFAACFPAMRAARVDPLTALRVE